MKTGKIDLAETVASAIFNDGVATASMLMDVADVFCDVPDPDEDRYQDVQCARSTRTVRIGTACHPYGRQEKLYQTRKDVRTREWKRELLPERAKRKAKVQAQWAQEDINDTLEYIAWCKDPKVLAQEEAKAYAIADSVLDQSHHIAAILRYEMDDLQDVLHILPTSLRKDIVAFMQEVRKALDIAQAYNRHYR